MENLGHYKQMPPTFQKLQQLQDNLEKEGYSLESLGLMLNTEDHSYFVTPCDVITFASTGSDGIHFGLLTDFGTVTDLEDAYVVYISPMDFGSAVFLAARNLKEFTDLLFTMKDAMEIGNFLSFEMSDDEGEIEDEDQDDLYDEYEEDIEYEYNDEEDDFNGDDEDFLQESEYVLGRLKELLDCNIIENAKVYYKDLFKKREQQIAIRTQDGIGVIPMTGQPITTEKYEVDEDTVIEVEALQTYFQETSIENKVAFIRDAQNLGIILDDRDVKEFILAELRKLGFKIEADRLERSHENELPTSPSFSVTHTFAYYESD